MNSELFCGTNGIPFVPFVCKVIVPDEHSSVENGACYVSFFCAGRECGG